MPLPYVWITKAQFEDRIGAENVQRLYDDNNDGVADDDTVGRLLLDASSKVSGYLRPIYLLDKVQQSLPNLNEVQRLTLDIAVVYAAQRHGEYIKRDWEKLLKAAESDLDKLHNGETLLDIVDTPEPGAGREAVIESAPARGW